MEILEIQSSHSLITSMPGSRESGAHVYRVHCRQFASALKNWQKNDAPRGLHLAVMTLGMDRIWITKEEAELVAASIQSARSPLALG